MTSFLEDGKNAKTIEGTHIESAKSDIKIEGFPIVWLCVNVARSTIQIQDPAKTHVKYISHYGI